MSERRNPYGVSEEHEPAWGQAESLWQPDRAAFWLFVVLFFLGSAVVFFRAFPALGVDIGATSLAFVAWALYALPFIAVIVGLDLLEPEPPPFLAAAFAWGAVVAVSVAIIANSSLLSIVSKLGGAEFTQEWWPAIAGPSTEEVLKALGIVVVVLIARRQVNTLLDGLVYGAFVGLAFQVSENFLYTVDKLQTTLFSQTPGSVVGDMLLLRGLGLGLWSHAVYTAIAGVGIAYFVTRTDRSLANRWVVAAGLLMVAWLFHFVWNAPWWGRHTSGTLGVDDIPVFVLKGLPALLLLFGLWVMAHRREVVWFDDALIEETDVTPEERAALRTLHGRRRAAREDGRRGGPRAALLRRQLQRAQVRLAVAVARSGAHTGDAVEAARRDVRVARAALDAALPISYRASSPSAGAG
jgi:RsiW-degrading membrane proteinase PrsW (M82 family)